MNRIEMAHEAHYQALRSLSFLKERENRIYALMATNDYAGIVKEKKCYIELVEKLKELLNHYKDRYETFDDKEKAEEEGITLRRLFLNFKYLDETLMP